jgi:outer membrane protein
MQWIYVSIFISIFVAEAGAQTPRFSLSLSQAEEQTLQKSPALKAALASSEAASFQALTAKSPLWPRLSLEGSYFYLSNVPEKDLGPLGVVAFGSHSNYAVGPMLSYTLFDGGRDRGQFESLKALSEARKADAQNRVSQLRLALRVGYYRVQLAARTLILTANSLKLAQAHSYDIDNRFRAGAASRLDQISAHKEQLSYQLRFNQAQTQLGVALNDLFSLTGHEEVLNTSRPVPEELLRNIPSGTDPPTLVIQVDTIEKSLEKIGGKQSENFSLQHPELLSLEKAAEASRSAAESARGGYWPKLQIYAKSQLIYPNLIIPEQVQQNTLGINLSLPLFEGRLTPNQTSQRNSEAIAADQMREQKRRDFERDWRKLRDNLENLQRQRKINQQNVSESKLIEKLTYDTYRSGRARFLDVQSANFRLLEAEMAAAEVDQQILEQSAQLEYLSGQAEDKSYEK